MTSILGSFREAREQSPENYPYPLYFEPGGIFPWGVSDDGDFYFWLTKGSPDKWAVVTIPRNSEVEYFDAPMCLFIAQALKGQLRSGAILIHAGSAPARRQVTRQEGVR